MSRSVSHESTRRPDTRRDRRAARRLHQDRPAPYRTGVAGVCGGVGMIAEIPMRHAIRAWPRRQSGSWAEADEADLQAWLLAAPEHHEAYEKVARTWEAT